MCCKRNQFLVFIMTHIYHINQLDHQWTDSWWLYTLIGLETYALPDPHSPISQNSLLKKNNRQGENQGFLSCKTSDSEIQAWTHTSPNAVFESVGESRQQNRWSVIYIPPSIQRETGEVFLSMPRWISRAAGEEEERGMRGVIWKEREREWQ